MKEHIQNIEISNFKSIKDLKIDGCKKINIFAGKPNAGKSNILEALGIFGLINYPYAYTLHDFIRFDNLNNIFYENNISEKIHLSTSKKNKLQIDLNFNDLIIYDVNFKGKDVYLMFDDEGNDKNLHSQTKDFVVNNNVKKYFFNTNNSISSRATSPNLLFPYGDNLTETIQSNASLRKEIIELFKNNDLKLVFEKNSNELRIFKEYQDGTVFTLPYSMIADTLQRLIFYKAAIMSNQNSVLLFEEPEAHCFEPYILEFTNEVKYNENNNQFFMVTHSDFIIQEFLRDEESRNDTQIYLVNNVDGETKVKKLDAEKNNDVYEYGMNLFFNFDSLWENN